MTLCLNRSFLGAVFFLIPLISLSAPLDVIQKRAQDLKLDQSLQWHRLLHYQKSFWGSLESQVDGEEFFNHPQGKQDPLAELLATLKALASSKIPQHKQGIDIHPLCRFPARYRWLKSQLPDFKTHFTQKDCPAYQKFKSFGTLKSLSLVFSSYHVNSPGSIYGHTLLKFNMAENDKNSDLLNYGVNFAAVVTVNNPFLYTINGLTGGFRGIFAYVPYYHKVREYNDYESRDLWDYKLNLAPNELERIHDHVWELGNTHMDYYYLSENCSYHMLSILEVGRPQLNLLDKLPFYVIPIETVKVTLNEKGFVNEISYRPSVWTKFHYRLKDLPPQQINLIKNIVLKEDYQGLENSSPKQKMAILDTSIDYFDFLYASDIGKKRELEKRKRDLLIRRSKIKSPSPDLNIPMPNSRPHESHSNRKVYAQQRYQKDLKNITSLNYRFSLHDQMDPINGYLPSAQVILGDFGVSYFHKINKLKLDQTTLLNIMSMNPLDEFQKKLSWQIDLGLEQLQDITCSLCTYARLEVMGGYSFSLLPNKLLAYTFLGSQLGGHKDFRRNNVDLRPLGEAGLRLSLNDRLFSILTWRSAYALFTRPNTFIHQAQLSMRYHFLPWGIEVGGKWNEFKREVYSQVQWFY